MNFSFVILVVVVAAIAYFIWGRRDKGTPPSTMASPAPAPKAAPLPAPVPAPPPIAPAPAPATVVAPAAAVSAPAGVAASFEAYRAAHPSNMMSGQLTCFHCGNTLITAQAGTATCGSCGAPLYKS